MPQMMPMNWLMIMLSVSLIMYITISFLYFFKYPNFYKLNPTIKVPNWNWKW